VVVLLGLVWYNGFLFLEPSGQVVPVSHASLTITVNEHHHHHHHINKGFNDQVHRDGPQLPKRKHATPSPTPMKSEEPQTPPLGVTTQEAPSNSHHLEGTNVDTSTRSTSVSALSLAGFDGLEPDEVLRRLEDHQEITFLSIGDWGRNSPPKTMLADAMAQWSERENAAFILSCGDSFYSSPTHKNHGIASVHDPYIKECFEDVFHHPALQRQKWFISIGNHDYPPHAPTTNIQAQVAYTKLSKRWYLPAPYYTYKVKAKGWSVEIFVLDHYDPKEYNSINTANPYPVQFPWLEQKLKASTADWKIMLCHRPFYSSGSWHGTYPLWKKAIYPILMKYKVQVYFAGDDHILEALKDSAGFVHIVSGAGSHMHGFGRTDRNSLFKFNKHGFTLHKMNHTHMHTKLIDFNGKVLYEFDITRDGLRSKV
jgi:hypothetical protein